MPQKQRDEQAVHDSEDERLHVNMRLTLQSDRRFWLHYMLRCIYTIQESMKRCELWFIEHELRKISRERSSTGKAPASEKLGSVPQPNVRIAHKVCQSGPACAKLSGGSQSHVFCKAIALRLIQPDPFPITPPAAGRLSAADLLPPPHRHSCRLSADERRRLMPQPALAQQGLPLQSVVLSTAEAAPMHLAQHNASAPLATASYASSWTATSCPDGHPVGGYIRR